MSRICYYVRTGEAALDILSNEPDSIFSDLRDLPSGSEVVDIDKAYDAIAWLASPLKRAEALHSARLIADPGWSDADVRESICRLNEMAADDALIAIEGVTDERIDGFDFGLGGAAVFRPGKVQSLALALSKLDEDTLRRNADFALMDQHDVQPGDWQKEGEDTLAAYILPALSRLKAFYATASELKQIVLVVWT
jgi:hypothetical protein